MFVDRANLPEHLAKEVQRDEGLWVEFLRCVFTDEQIAGLKKALKEQQPVYFCGRSLGKSTLAVVLQKAGFEALEPGMYEEGYPSYIPDGKDLVVFPLKEPREYILGEDIRETLMSNVEAIRGWINL